VRECFKNSGKADGFSGHGWVAGKIKKGRGAPL